MTGPYRACSRPPVQGAPGSTAPVLLSGGWSREVGSDDRVTHLPATRRRRPRPRGAGALPVVRAPPNAPPTAPRRAPTGRARRATGRAGPHHPRGYRRALGNGSPAGFVTGFVTAPRPRGACDKPRLPWSGSRFAHGTEPVAGRSRTRFTRSANARPGAGGILPVELPGRRPLRGVYVSGRVPRHSATGPVRYMFLPCVHPAEQ